MPNRFYLWTRFTFVHFHEYWWKINWIKRYIILKGMHCILSIIEEFNQRLANKNEMKIRKICDGRNTCRSEFIHFCKSKAKQTLFSSIFQCILHMARVCKKNHYSNKATQRRINVNLENAIRCANNLHKTAHTHTKDKLKKELK